MTSTRPGFDNPSDADTSCSWCFLAFLFLSSPSGVSRCWCLPGTVVPCGTKALFLQWGFFGSSVSDPDPFSFSAHTGCLFASEELWNQGWCWENDHLGVQRHLLLQLCCSRCSQAAGTLSEGHTHTDTCTFGAGWRKCSSDWELGSLDESADRCQRGSMGDMICEDMSVEIKALQLPQLSMQPHSHALETHNFQEDKWKSSSETTLHKSVASSQERSCRPYLSYQTQQLEANVSLS